jgi:hypothetical protein
MLSGLSEIHHNGPMKKILHFVTVGLFLSPILALAGGSNGSLDGSSYVVEILRTGEQLFINENLEFTAGRFETTFMEDGGLGKGEYTASSEESAIKWNATVNNKSGDTVLWEGTVSEGKIQGRITKKTGKDSGATWTFKSAARE